MNERSRLAPAALEGISGAAAVSTARLCPDHGALPALAGNKAALERRSAWIAIAAIVLVAIDLRPGIVSIGPVLPAIQAEFGLTHAGASMLTTIPDLLMGLLALPTPWLARRFGRDPLLLGALLLLCVAMLARSFSPNTATLLATTAGVGAGIAIAGTLFAGFVKARFPTRAAGLMGIYSMALSCGATISASFTGPIAAAGGAGNWRFASGIWSALGVVSIGAWLVVSIQEHRSRRAASAPATVANPVGLPWRNRTAWLVALFFALVNLLFYAMISWTVPMFSEGGASPIRAGLLLTSFTVAFMCASPIFGTLSKSQDRRGWLALSGVLTSAGLIAIALAPDSSPFVWVPMCAFGLGGAFTLGMTLPLDNTHSPEEANAWNAFVLTIGYLIAAAGPLLVGALRDATGSFRLPVALLALVAIATLALTPLLKPQAIAGGR